MKKEVKNDMCKWFVVSDIHSFYKELKSALDTAEFDKTNKEHHLVVLGDVFDRGPETVEVYKFLESVPKDRLTLVKGNHEELYLDLLKKDFPDQSDFSNGTVKTFCHIANMSEDSLKWSLDLNINPRENWQLIKKIVNDSAITKWLKSSIWVNYIEFGRFIGVHSFIPVKLKEKYNKFSYYGYELNPGRYEYFNDWRKKATESDWSVARWGNPWLQYLEGLFTPEEEEGKTLICGHWHCSDFRIHLGGEEYKNEEEINYNSYISKGIIGIDACTVLSKKVNVLVIENDEVISN